MGPVIARENPLGPDLTLLMARHTADMHADTPDESIHMMDATQLAKTGVWFYVMRLEDRPVGMGAFKQLTQDHAEIKSMHVLLEYRGQGLSRVMLDHLIAEAAVIGITRLSLETGAAPMFAPAHKLYLRAGFVECPPFGDYTADPNSLFMTRLIA